MNHHELLQIIPTDQIEDVFSCYGCELDAEFLGFTEVYKNLAAIIPHHFAIIDFGCYCAAQAFYFTDHARYIGVDVYKGKRFDTKNSIHLTLSIQRFIKEHSLVLPKDRVFAISSYVPDTEANALIRATYPNLFVYYPSLHSPCKPKYKKSSITKE